MLALIRDRNGPSGEEIEDVAFGCVSPVGEQGAVITRTAVLAAGYPHTTSGIQVNSLLRIRPRSVEYCGGQGEVGRVRPRHWRRYYVDEPRSWGPMAARGRLTRVRRLPTISFRRVSRRILIATKYGYSRDDVDAYAVESQKRAAKSRSEKRFAKSILPIHDVIGEIILDHDELMRPETDMQSLGALAPASLQMMGTMMPGFDDIAIMRYPDVEKINHVHHAGNSSGIVDGSAAVLIGTKEAGEKYGLKARARIVSMASVGSEPSIMLTGPEFAAQKALARAGMDKGDIDVWELNEAHLLRSSCVFMEALNIDHGDINVNGGAIAMGHPLGRNRRDDLGHRSGRTGTVRKIADRASTNFAHRRRHGHSGDHHRTRELIGI